MAAWGWWLVAAGLLGAAEITTLTLVFGMLSLASLVGLLAEGLGAPPLAQVLIALASSVPLLLVLRPFAQRYLHRRTPELRSGAAGYIGRAAKVTEQITPSEPGKVTVHGEIWPAVATVAVTEGETVRIDAIDGPNLVVSPAG
jgi:membrane protein implicated in regulation of membrane protease activity